MKPKLLIFSYIDWIIICVVVILSVFLFVFPFWNYNNQALFYMVQKKYEEAEKKWRQALSKNTFFPFYRMNLALNYILWDQPEKAIQEYEVTRNLFGKINSSNKEEILFYDFFNSAVAATQRRDKKQALDFYQKALVPKPNSIEVKTNIELLIQESKSSSQDEKKEDSKNSQNDEQRKKEGDGKGEEEKNQQEGDKEPLDLAQEESKQKQGDEEENKEETSSYDEDNQDKNKDTQSDFQKEQGSKESDKKNLNKKQTEAILKAILEQEKNIRERRQQEKKKNPIVEKDW